MLYILVVIFSYFFHAHLHEYLHLLATKITVGVDKYKIKVYPHIDSKLGFVWASVWTARAREANNFENGIIYFSPRFANILFAVIIALMCLQEFELSIYWKIFIASSMVDLFVGSLGVSEKSDLQMYSKYWNLNPWIPRLAGVAVSIFSLIILI